MTNDLFEVEPSWKAVLAKELALPYITHLAAFLARERAGNIPIYPRKELVFNAFRMTPFEKVRVVIVGQDPYHGAGQAHGLSFSVPEGIPPPPSLQNIFKELSRDLGMPIPKHGCLTSWAQQGILLLNATLTVREGQPLSHHRQGWERFTDAVIEQIAHKKEPVIFVLWGKSAREKCKYLEATAFRHHLILTAPHPSPLSAHQGFFGCGHFSKINDQLQRWGYPKIQFSSS